MQGAPEAPGQAYVLLREANRLQAEGQVEGARALLRRGFQQAPSLPLAFRLADLTAAAGDPDEAVRLMGFLRHLKVFEPEQVMLVRDIAKWLAAAGEGELAVVALRNLLTSGVAPREQQLLLLTEAADLASQAGDESQAIEWRRQRTAMENE